MASRPIKISIIGDNSNLRKSLKGASKQLAGFGKSVAKVGATAGVAFAGLAAGVATKGVTAFADFEKGMNEVMTLLPDAGEEAFGELSKQVKDFSKEFGVLPDKAIPSLYSALSAGVPKDNVFEFMEIAQKAAKGGVTELETAVDALSSVVNAYGSEAITATESSDLLLTAVRLGKTTFEELAAEVYKVAPIAASVGVPFENLTASIAVLTSQGVPTAQSATMLKGALAELAKEGTKADTAFREFAGEGLSSFLEGGGTFEEAIMGMATQAEASGVSVLDLFGSVEAGQAILSLTSDGGAAFSSVLDQMGESSGATQAAFETMDGGMSASFDKIKANLSVLAIDIGERVAPYVVTASEAMLVAFENIGPVVDRTKEIARAFADEFMERVVPAFHATVDAVKLAIEWIKTHLFPIALTVAAAMVVAYEAVREALVGAFDWMMEHKDLSIVLGGAVAGLVAGLVIFKTTTLAIAAAQKVAATASAVWNAVLALNPIMLVVVAIVALIGALVAAYFRFDEVREIVDKVFDVMQDWGKWLQDNLWPLIKIAAEKITEAVKAVIRYFQNDFVPTVKTVVKTVTDIWRVLAQFFETFVEPIIRAAIEGVISVLGNLWDVVQSTVALIKAIFSGDMGEIWRTFRTLVGETIQFVVDLMIALPVKILNAAKPLIGKFALIVSDFAVHLVGKIIKLVAKMPAKIIELLGAVGSDLLQAGKNLGSKIIDGIINAIKGAASAVGNAITGLIPGGGLLSSAGGFLKGLNPFGGDKKPPKPGTMTEEVYAFNPATGEVELVPQMARGGIVRSPTLAMIGERGPEAVVPLNRAGSLGATFNITVHAGMGTDGHQVGNDIVSALKQWERANGSLPLNISAA